MPNVGPQDSPPHARLLRARYDLVRRLRAEPHQVWGDALPGIVERAAVLEGTKGGRPWDVLVVFADEDCTNPQPLVGERLAPDVIDALDDDALQMRLLQITVRGLTSGRLRIDAGGEP